MKKIFILLLLFAAIFSCKEERSGIDFPAVTTSDQVLVAEDGAQIDFSIEYANSNSLLDCGVEYRISSGADTWVAMSLGPQTGGSMSLSAMLYTNLLPDVEYIARAYAKTADRTVYGNEVVFVSQGSKTPKILSVEPIAADIGDTLTIRGEYFSTMPGYSNVSFNSKEATPVYSSDSLLKVIVPGVTSSSNIRISVSANLKKVEYALPFSLAVATISKIEPEEAFPGDDVILVGDNFRSLTTVDIGGTTYQPLSQTDSTFTFRLQVRETTGLQSINLLQLDRHTLSDKTLSLILPEFISASPEVCWIDTIIKVRGKYLDRVTNVGVDYNWFSNQLISQTDTLVVMKQKTVFGMGIFTGNFRGLNIGSPQLIRMNPPVVTSIEPSTAKYGETVTLKGDRFYNGLSSDDGNLTYVSKTEMKMTLWPTLPAGQQSIHFNSGSNMVYPSSAVKVTIPKIEIAGFSKTEVTRGEAFEMYTSNLPLEWSAWVWPEVSLDGIGTGAKLSVGSGTIGLKLAASQYYSEYPVVKLAVGVQSHTLNNTLHVLEPWSEPVTFNTLQYPVFVASADKAYAFEAASNGGTLYSFNSVTEQWEYESFLTTPNYFYVDASAIGNDLYFYGSYSETNNGLAYKYSRLTKKWTRLPDFPLSLFGNDVFSFVINNQLYVGTDKGMYAFDAINSVWEKKATCPKEQTFSIYSCNVAVGGKGYFASHSNATYDQTPNELWEYNPDTDSWTTQSSNFDYIFMGSRQCVAGNTAYLVCDTNEYPYTGRVFEFNPQSGSLKEFLVPPIGLWGAGFPYVSGQYLYVFNYGKFSKIPLSEIADYYR